MSSDPSGSDGQGGQDSNQNLADALAANEAITGQVNNARLTELQGAGADVSGSPGFSGNQATQSTQPQQINALSQIGLGRAFGAFQNPSLSGRVGNGTFSNNVLSDLSDAVANLGVDEFSQLNTTNSAATTLNSDEDFVDETDDSITGSPLSYSNMVDIQNAVDEAEPTLMSNFLGGRYDAEYDPKNGWQSVDNTTAKDVLTSPAAFTLASFGVGAPLGAGTVAKKGFDLASDNLVGKTNQYGSPVMDNTRNYDDDSVLNSLFGVPLGNTFSGGVPFTDAERQQAFGDGGQGDRPPQRRAYFPSGQPAQELAPTDPRAYTNPRFKRNSHSWGPGSGYTFNMADIEEFF